MILIPGCLANAVMLQIVDVAVDVVVVDTWSKRLQRRMKNDMMWEAFQERGQKR